MQIFYFQNVFESDFLGIIAFREVCLPQKVPCWPICMFTLSLLWHTRCNQKFTFFVPFSRDFSYNHLSGNFPSWATEKNLQLYVYVLKLLSWKHTAYLLGTKPAWFNLTVIANFPHVFYFVLRNLVANDFVMDSSNNRWMPVHPPCYC